MEITADVLFESAACGVDVRDRPDGVKSSSLPGVPRPASSAKRLWPSVVASGVPCGVSRALDGVLRGPRFNNVLLVLGR